MTDTVTPGFKGLSKAGKFTFSPLYKSMYQCVPLGGSGYVIKTIANTCVSPSTQTWYELRDCKAGLLPFLLPTTMVAGKQLILPVRTSMHDDSRRMRAAVATSVRNKRGRTDANLWESIAEIDKTVTLLNPKLERAQVWMERFAKAVQRQRTVRHSIDAAARAWLAMRYGIVPLINDISHVVDVLPKVAEKAGRQIRTSRAKESFERKSSHDSTYDLGVTRSIIRAETWSSLTVRGCALDEVDLSIANLVGFDSKGLMTLPWELLSMSFVADWFANIGDYIGAIIPAIGWDFKGGSLTEIKADLTRFSIVSSTLTPSGAALYTMPTSSTGALNVQELTKRREWLPEAELTFRNDFGFDRFKRSADALSLFSVLLSGLSQGRTLKSKPDIFAPVSRWPFEAGVN